MAFDGAGFAKLRARHGVYGHNSVCSFASMKNKKYARISSNKAN